MRVEYLDILLSRLSGVRELGPGRYMARCPAHDDQHPSLSIKVTDDRILLHCFAGCKYQDILQALGFEREADPNEPEDIYIYRDVKGKPLFRKLRFPGKRFVIEHLRGLYWAKGQGQAPNVLYNLPEVRAATKVYLVEGEKDADNLMRFGLVATTNPHGASERDLSGYTEHFRGKEVVLIPDQDEQGRQLAQRWIELLFPLAKSLKCIELPPPAKDVSDFLANHTIEELFELEKAAEELSAFAIKEEVSEAVVSLSLRHIRLVLTRGKQDTRGFDFWNYHAETNLGTTWGRVAINNLQARRREAEVLEGQLPTGIWAYLFERAAERIARPTTQLLCLAETSVPPPSFLLKPFILNEGANIIFGPGGTLKSHLALVFAKCIANNWLPSGNHDLELFGTGRVLFLDWEDDISPFLDRAKRLALDLDKIFYAKCTKPFFDMLPEVRDLVEKADPALVVIDSLGPAIAGGNAFSLETAAAFISAAKSLERPFLIVAHPPKQAKETVYGSVFFENLARNIFQIDMFLPEPPYVTLELSNKKASYFDGANFAYRVMFTFLGTRTMTQIDRIKALPKTLALQIVNVLAEKNYLTFKELRALLPEVPESQIKKELQKLKAFGRVSVEDGRWFLLDLQPEEEVPF